MSWEFVILNWLQTIHSSILDKIMVFITSLGNVGLIWLVMAVILMLIPKMRKTGIMMTAALLIDVILCNGILKNLFARVRPCEINQDIQLLIARPKDYSFPSGHTAISFTAVTVLYLMKEKTLWKSSLLLAILIAFSRMYLYVHYPTDIIGGIMTGIVSGIMGVQLINWFQNRQKR